MASFENALHWDNSEALINAVEKTKTLEAELSKAHEEIKSLKAKLKKAMQENRLSPTESTAARPRRTEAAKPTRTSHKHRSN